MTKITLPQILKNTVNVFAKNCPQCGETPFLDQRYKTKTESFTLTNRRWTERTVTRECKICGLRFSFTWKSFANALRRQAKTEINKEFAKILTTRAKYIEECFDLKTSKKPRRRSENFKQW